MIYIVYNSGHDFSSARQYGSFRFLSELKLSRFDTVKIYKTFIRELKDSQPDDLILISALNVMNAIACCIMVAKHKRLNILIYNNMTSDYVKKTIEFSSIGE